VGRSSRTSGLWPDDVDEILGGDQCIMLAFCTPARGVVLLPVTNFAIRDSGAETITAVNSSVGVSKKLERMRSNPQVALAYHTRAHGWSDRPEYVLVQGRASLSAPHRRYFDTIPESVERQAGGNPKGGFFWDWWLRAFHIRVGVTVEVERVVVWPDIAARGTPQAYGSAVPAKQPASQPPPGKGTGPRLNQRRAARRAARAPDTLLGWVGADGFPFVVPVGIGGSEERGIVLEAPVGLVPAGARRAGLTAHRFGNYNIAQRQYIHTGWLESVGGRAVYAPHTRAGYWMPNSVFAFKLLSGAGTRWGLPAARRRGFMPEPKQLQSRRTAA
jgi:hypothetical protein